MRNFFILLLFVVSFSVASVAVVAMVYQSFQDVFDGANFTGFAISFVLSGGLFLLLRDDVVY